MALLIKVVLVCLVSLAPVEHKTCSLIIEVNGLRNIEGNLSISLFKGEEGFPDEASKATDWKVVKIKGKQVVVDFAGLAPGQYAFCLLHDENANGKMDYSWMGFPKEGYACSNNAVGKVKPPRFDTASLELSSGTIKQSIEMLYW